MRASATSPPPDGLRLQRCLGVDGGVPIGKSWTLLKVPGYAAVTQSVGGASGSVIAGMPLGAEGKKSGTIASFTGCGQESALGGVMGSRLDRQEGWAG